MPKVRPGVEPLLGPTSYRKCQFPCGGKVDLEEAKEFLSKCDRWELRDHAFGDVEITWLADDIEVGYGYFSGSDARVTVDQRWRAKSFLGDDAKSLRECGVLVEVERNDSTGPDTYVEGVTMPGLTEEGVLSELTG